MLEYDEYKIELSSMEEAIVDLGRSLDIDGALVQIKELEEKTATEGFWDDMENSQKILQKMKGLKAKVEKYDALKGEYDDTLVLIDMANGEDDDSYIDEIGNTIKKIRSDLETMTLETLLSGEYDKNNAIITLHSGAGGTESQDWVEMLLRMYTRWAEKKRYSIKMLDLQTLVGEQFRRFLARNHLA